MIAERNSIGVGQILFMEVISAHDPGRDRIKKRREYAMAGITEYWLLTPFARKLWFVFTGQVYQEHGPFSSGQMAPSVLLPGFEVSVTDVLNADS